MQCTRLNGPRDVRTATLASSDDFIRGTGVPYAAVSTDMREHPSATLHHAGLGVAPARQTIQHRGRRQHQITSFALMQNVLPSSVPSIKQHGGQKLLE